MQQFAIASMKSRSIAWLIRVNEWDRFEEIIKYNCAMIGGYFNVVIPLSEEDTISEEYLGFLVGYDPDIIVLAPNMLAQQINYSCLHPFGIVPWEMVSGIALLDPLAGGSGTNLTMISEWINMAKEHKQFVNVSIATADETKLDMSRLALAACGDVEPREPMWSVMDEDIHLDATGYREHFLERFIGPDIESKEVGAYLDDEKGIVPAPDRYKLNKIILDEHKFPMAKATDILKTSFKLQHYPKIYQSFIGLTATHKITGTPHRKLKSPLEEASDIVILISDNFNLEEAILFWNLRANGIYVSWLSFSEIENNTDEIVQWLDSDYTAVYYFGRGGITFSSPYKDIARLEVVIEKLVNKRKNDFPNWYFVPYHNLVSYSYVIPSIQRERVVVSKDISKCSFIVKSPIEHATGECTVTLEWNGLMLPQNSSIVYNWISSQETSHVMLDYGRKNTGSVLKMPKFRIIADRYLRVQTSAEDLIEFNRPSAEQVIETIFASGGFSRLEPSSTARYHKNFVERAGSLENAVRYLSVKPYRGFLELLADNRNKNKSGWILESPSKRRVVHHFHLRDELEEFIPEQTKAYFDTVSDSLPVVAFELLEKGIIERGFKLTCSSCSFTSWYPAEQIGQAFKCTRCYQQQVYKTNPLWLYKLVEVIFRGFEDNMQVPLLALKHLKGKSKYCFEWMPDSDAYWTENDNSYHKNIDLLCISDGKLYIGEAKSNDVIEKEQISFYELVCRQVEIDGIVFATTKPQWSRGTFQQIEQLKSWFTGDVLLLTEKELYPGS